MKRTKHNLGNYKLATFDMGELVPIQCTEVLPGDTFQGSSSILLRCSPLMTPVMHPVSVRIHHWFVPFRILWDGWEDFITGGPDGEGGSSGAFPTITAGGSGFAAGSLMDYFGVPPGVANLEVSELPVRAYNKIFNECYRDQDLVTARLEDDVTVAKVAWEKDYFTASRPDPQKGPDILLPLGTQAPVIGDGSAMLLQATTGGATRSLNGTTADTTVRWSSLPGAVSPFGLHTDPAQSHVYADLSGASAVNVNDVRLAFALQRYEEARSRYGSRYTEYLRYLGVRSSDARLQRPEYLGGGRQTISFSEVLQTGVDSADEGVGTLRGHGIAAMRSNRYRKFFEEHGVVITLASVRPRSMYGDACNRLWFRRVKEDFWQKELEHIGQQEVYRREIYAQSDAAGGDTVLGWQNRYDEYRHVPSTIAGDFRTTLNDWHLARQFGAAPALNSDLVTCTPTKRVFAEQTQDVLWVMASNQLVARRMVSHVATNRIY